MHIPGLLSAFLIPSGTVVLLAYYGLEYQRGHFDLDKWFDFDPEYIEKEWAFRNKNRYLLILSGSLIAVGWIFFCITLLEFSWVSSRRGKESIALHVSIAFIAISAAFTEGLSIFLYLGSASTAKFVTNDLNLDHWLGSSSSDKLGWRANELVHIVLSGFLIFVNSFEYICMFFIMVLLHISVRRWRLKDTTSYGLGWNALSLFIGLLSLLDFTAAILRLEGFQVFGLVTFFYSILSRVILLPLWMLIFARRLPTARMVLDAPAEMPQELMEEVTT